MAISEQPVDFQLAKAIRELDQEIQPERDLWAGIERNIVAHPQGLRFDWMPYGVAASLLIAVSALLINVMRPVDVITPVSFDRSMGQMHNEYLQVKNPLVEQFNKANESLDPATLQELHRNIEILEMARRQIEEQVRQDPDNPRLVEMLMSVHQQEIELLKRDFTDLSTSL